MAMVQLSQLAADEAAHGAAAHADAAGTGVDADAAAAEAPAAAGKASSANAIAIHVIFSITGFWLQFLRTHGPYLRYTQHISLLCQ